MLDVCNFLNYLLKYKLRNNDKDISICVKEFYEEIKLKDVQFFSKHSELEKYLHIIDPEILENMKFLYELYYNAVKIINMITNQVHTDEEQKSCSHYIKECDEKYKEAMNRCLNNNVDYYNALIIFKNSYQFLAKPSSEKKNTCDSNEFFFFLKYDPVLERKKKIMLIQYITTPFNSIIHNSSAI
ncbi:PIR protein [Plasmodium ovale]|uniref:PIR protein n=1 Tax=Plasmodium ovale TaxID=36330 RepID=A0A1D3JF32_PLAOA|nr:PIR protein [Plasmodium ovale]